MRHGLSHDGHSYELSTPLVPVHDTARESKEASVVERQEEHMRDQSSSPSSPPTFASILREWYLEAVYLLVAVACLIAIIKLLVDANGAKLEDWKLKIGINTIAALLATLFRSTIAQVTGEVISQLKWMRPGQQYPLIDLQHFDDASRGPWGSFLLPFRLRKLLFVELGCFLTIISYATGTFIQQAIRTELCHEALPDVGSGAVMPLARGSRVGVGVINDQQNSWSIDIATTGAALGILSDPASSRATLLSGCSTGNCSFAPTDKISYSTVGFCSKCIDTIDMVEESLSSPVAPFSILTGPSNLKLYNITSVALNVTTGLIGAENIELPADHLDVLPVTLANVSILAMSDAGCTYSNTSYQWTCEHGSRPIFSQSWDSTNILSSACSIYTCMKNYRVQVLNGEVKETLVSSSPANYYSYQGALGPTQIVIDQPCFNDAGHPIVVTKDSFTQAISDPSVFSRLTDTSVSPFEISSNSQASDSQTLPMKCVNPLDAGYARAMQDLLTSLISGGQCRTASSNMNALGSPPGPRQHIQCYQGVQDGNGGSRAWWLPSLDNGGNATLDSFSNHMSLLAEVLTDRLRTDAYQASDPRTFAKGTVDRTTVCTRLVWEWLLLPAGILLLTTIFFVATVVWTIIARKEIPLWKSSILPYLYAAEDRVPEGSATSSALMELMAETTVVTLQSDSGGGWKLRKQDF